jgi:hypothetical protein
MACLLLVVVGDVEVKRRGEKEKAGKLGDVTGASCDPLVDQPMILV